MAVRRQEKREQWIFEQLTPMETASSPEHETGNNDMSASYGKKRKLSGDRSSLARHPPPKRKRQEVH